MAKSVLITGCSEGGMGDYLARDFHKRGFRVFATARNLKKVEHLKALGLDVLALDVTSEESISAAVKDVKAITGGTLNFLVNNSGSGCSMPLLDVNIGVAKKMFDVNVFGLIAVTQAFSSLLIAAKGKIINIGSVVGRFPAPYMGMYNASKAAVNLLGDNLRIELAPFGVQVITVIAGVVRTNFLDNLPSNVLPEDSVYLSIKGKAEDVMNGEGMAGGAMDPVEFARGVIDNALKSTSKPRFWYGARASIVWFVTTFLWHTFMDSKLSKDQGLADFSVSLKKQKSG